jgi:hypothetical protein
VIDLTPLKMAALICNRKGVMRPSRISTPYQQMSCEERIEFDRWLNANVVVALLFSVALVAMAFAGSRSSEPAEGAAAHSGTTSQPAGVAILGP